MPIDPRISFGVRPMQVLDPLEQFARFQGVRNLLTQAQTGQQEVQMNEMKLQQARSAEEQRRRDLQDEQALQSIWAEAGGKPDAILKAAAGKVRAGTWLGLQKQFNDARKTVAEIDDKELPGLKYRNEQLSALLNQVLALPDDQYIAQWPTIRAAARGIDPDLQIPEEPMDRKALAVNRLRFTTADLIFKEEEEKRKQAAEKRTGELHPSALKKAEQDAIAAEQGVKGTEPIQPAEAARIANTAATAAETRRHNLATESQEPLVQVIGPDGKPRWARRSTAVGQPAAGGAAGATGKPLPVTAIRDLEKKANIAEQVSSLESRMKDEFFGNTVTGRLETTIGEYGGETLGITDQGQTDWWKAYQDYINVVRNQLFGAALSAHEQAEFTKAIITARSAPSVARVNLARQKALTNKAVERLADTYKAGGYNQEQIDLYRPALAPKPLGAGSDLSGVSTEDLFKRLNAK